MQENEYEVSIPVTKYNRARPQAPCFSYGVRAGFY